MFHYKPPIICRVPAIANVVCPKCEKIFKYLADRIDTEKPHPVNQCPKCDWVLDDDFYRSIQDKYKVIEFASLKAHSEFAKEFRRRNRDKKAKLYLEDPELIKKYESLELIWVLEEDFNWVKGGYVWELPQYQPLNRSEKIYNKFVEIVTDILPFLDKHLKYIEPRAENDRTDRTLSNRRPQRRE